MYGLVLFDDGVYHCTKSIKRRSNGRYIAKWNSYWFEAKLLCSGSRELCLFMKKSIVFALPYVELVKIDFHSNYNEDNEKDCENNEKNLCDNNNEKDLCDNNNGTDLCENIEKDLCENNIEKDLSKNNNEIDLCENNEIDLCENNNGKNFKEVNVSDLFFENSDDSVADADYIPDLNSPESDTSTDSSQLVETNPQIGFNISIENGNLPRRNDTSLECPNNSLVHFQEIPITQVDSTNTCRMQLGNKLTRRNDTSLESTNTSFVDFQDIPNSKNKSKKYFCIYCKKLVTKFARHIETVHKDCFEVKKLLLLPKGCKERLQDIGALRKKGSFLFNTKNAYNNGQLLVTRRPHIEFNKNANDYKVCPHCKGFYSKNGIRRHYIKCKEDAIKGEKTLLWKSRRVHGQIHRKAENILKNIIIPKLRDDVTRIIRYDELAIVYGNKLCTKYRKPHLHYFIRSKLRLIGRLMIELKKINTSITDFASIFEPLYYDDVVKGVNKVALLDDGLTYRSPATAFSYGTLLKKCGQILINEHIKGDNEIAQKKVKNFLCLLQEDFANSVNKTVEENQLEKKRQKKVILPSNEDVKLLNKYLNKKRDEFYVKMKTEHTESNWLNLAEVLLTSIQVFNRRRAGEIERLSIADFKTNTIDQDTNCDIFNSLTDQSKKAAKQYYRCEIRGKLARNVPVLLHLNHLRAIELLIRYREYVGISKNNPYVFAMPGGDDKFFRACNLMRKFSMLCGANEPATLRGTQLRKHIATQSVLLDLQENEIADLANFMGHAEKIHKDHYRLPIVTRDIVRMSRLLEKAQGSDEYNLKSTESNSAQIELELGNNNEGTAVDGIGLVEVNEDGEKEALRKTPIMDVPGRKKRSVSPVGTVPRRSWSSPEKREAWKYFGTHIERNSLPSLEQCEEVINENSVFVGRNSLQLKAWISNQIVKKKTVQTGKKRRRETTNYWTTSEKEIMMNVFGRHLNKKKVPNFPECREAISKNPELKMRSIQTVKAWVNNEIRRTMKRT